MLPTARSALPDRNDQPWLDAHLAGVSRSFAACIATLPAQLRHAVGTSYLLCRLLDTIEDTPWPHQAAQARAFIRFDAFVRRKSGHRAAATWAATLPKPTSPAEAALIADAPRLFATLHALAGPTRRRLQRTVLWMSVGMRRSLAEHTQDGVFRLATAAEVHRYCFVVAGLVGTLLLDLFSAATVGYRRYAHGPADAAHFGLLLQKVNLLKDQHADEREGRWLVPDRASMRRSLANHIRYAGRFILSFPPRAIEVRRFCAWSLFLAAKSLGAIERAPGGKLPRAQTEALFVELGEACRSNETLRAALQQAQGALQQELSSGRSEPYIAATASGEPQRRRQEAELHERWLGRFAGLRHRRGIARALLS